MVERYRYPWQRRQASSPTRNTAIENSTREREGRTRAAGTTVARAIVSVAKRRARSLLDGIFFPDLAFDIVEQLTERLELIDRIAALVPPPRKHRLRYFGVLAPNSPLRSVVIALARGDPGSTGKAPVAGAVAAIGSSARYA